MFLASLRRTACSSRRTAIVRRSMASDMPVPQSQNAPLWHGHTVKNEGWETSMYFYFGASIILQAAVIMGAPETSIESWARPEAQARLKLAAEGFTEFEFGKHYQDVAKQASLDVWDKYASRSTEPGDDDFDDEDEEDEDDEDDDEVNDDIVDATTTATAEWRRKTHFRFFLIIHKWNSHFLLLFSG